MLGFFKRRKEAKTMAEIGRAYVGSVGDGVANDINKFFDAISQADAEMLELVKGRLAGVGFAEGISPKQESEIELQAAMDQWRETRVNLRQQSETFLANAFDIAKAIDATDQMREVVDKRWADADTNFQAQMVIAFGEATEGMGDTPSPGFVVEQADVNAIIVRIMNAPNGTLPSRELIGFYRRLVDIAWFDNHVSDEHRQLAEKTLTVLKTDILASMEPEAQKAFIEASDNQMEGIPFFGQGSLQWIMQEQGVTAAELVDFIVRPEFAHLLPTHLTMLEDDVLNNIRYPVLRSLIKARRTTSDQSDTRSLFRLLQHGDRAIDILLKADELKTLRGAEKDYPSAEAVVAKIMNS